jgi:hypothetical protein
MNDTTQSVEDFSGNGMRSFVAVSGRLEDFFVWEISGPVNSDGRECFIPIGGSRKQFSESCA